MTSRTTSLLTAGALLLGIAVIFLSFASVRTSALNTFTDGPFKVGDRVEVSVSGLVGDQYYDPCTVKEVRENGYMVVCSGVDFFVRPEWVRSPKAAPKAAPAPPADQQPEQAPAEPAAHAAFNAGDIVEASVSGLDSNDSYETCVITEVMDAKYRIVCRGMEFVVKTAWVRARTKTPLPLDRNPLKEEPSNAPCDTTPPGPEVQNSDNFSATLAKRKVYDNAAMNITGGTTAPLKTGIKFLAFTVTGSFTNTVNRGQRINDAAPPYATVYTAKSKHVLCEQYNRSTQKTEVETAYMCFKRRGLEWVCAADGPLKYTPLNY